MSDKPRTNSQWWHIDEHGVWPYNRESLRVAIREFNSSAIPVDLSCDMRSILCDLTFRTEDGWYAARSERPFGIACSRGYVEAIHAPEVMQDE